MKHKLKIAIVFLTGSLSGGILSEGVHVFTQRSGSIGGEALILPLIILLLICGYNLGRESKIFQSKNQTYEEGFRDGYHEATTRINH